MRNKLLLLGIGILCFAAVATAAPKEIYGGAFNHPLEAGRRGLTVAVSPEVSDPSSAMPATVQHQVVLSWTASSSFPCTGATPPCTSSGYNAFRGTVSGAESTTPLNSTLISGTTYTDSTVVLGSAPIEYFYVVQAVETAGGITVSSANSNEVNATFPGVPVAPVLAVPVVQ